MLQVQSLVDGNHPREPHYYLFAIGTLPELRGRGIGSKLMRPMIERMDRERAPAYLENSKQQNLGFYGRHGFADVARAAVTAATMSWQAHLPMESNASSTRTRFETRLRLFEKLAC